MVCRSCGLEIPPERLKAQPDARLCKTCAEEAETQLVVPPYQPPKRITVGKINREVLAEAIAQAKREQGLPVDLPAIRGRLRQRAYMMKALKVPEVRSIYYARMGIKPPSIEDML
jgi:hypothetical protein